MLFLCSQFNGLTIMITSLFSQSIDDLFNEMLIISVQAVMSVPTDPTLTYLTIYKWLELEHKTIHFHPDYR